MFKCLCLAVLMLHSSNYVEGVRILAVYPLPSRSHQNFFRPITQELLDRGHELVVITTDPIYPKGQALKNLTEIDVHDISYQIWIDTFMNTSRGDKNDLLNTAILGFTVLTEIFEKQIQSLEVKRMLKDNTNQIDLILLESSMMEPLAFSHLFKVPVIQISTMVTVNGNFECVGGSSHPILYPSSLKRKLSNLTIWDTFEELYNYYFIGQTLGQVADTASSITKRIYGADFPHYNKLHDNVDMLFVNMHPIGDLNRPLPPSVRYISGIYQEPTKELPKDLKYYLDSSKNGVIYVSFGTNTTPSSLRPSFIEVLLKVFSELPYDILFKWDLDELPNKPANVKIFDWLPQSDVLRHSNIKLFITQGGLQSTDEAISAGVPLIGIPMLVDQWFNTENYVKHKFGLNFEADTITEEELKNAIKTVLGDESYRQNMIRFRSLVYDQPQQPMDRAMWWIDHVIRHSGASHLRAPAANVIWTEYLELELIVICLAAVTFVVSLTVFAFRVLIMLLLKVKTKYDY